MKALIVLALLALAFTVHADQVFEAVTPDDTVTHIDKVLVRVSEPMPLGDEVIVTKYYPDHKQPVSAHYLGTLNKEIDDLQDHMDEHAVEMAAKVTFRDKVQVAAEKVVLSGE